MSAVKNVSIVGLLTFAAAPYLCAQPQWRHMQTENFQIYSQANDRDTRAALQYFERVRSFFIKVIGKEPDNPVPVYIVLFNSEKEYAPYKLNEFASAYYFGGAERDYIVMGKTGEQTAHTATHEYVHLVVRHLGLNWPAWMNEGQAEFFSTLKVIGDNTEYGDVIPGRLVGAVREKWVPLAAILEVDHDSPYYNEKNKASNFYNQSWLLVHMLATDPDYANGFAAVQRGVGQGQPGAAVLEQVYGKPLERIEAELKGYARGQTFRKVVMSVGVESPKLKDPSRPADEFEVRLALADLLNRPERAAERKSRLESLVKEFPTRPEAYASLGYLTWAERDNAGAARYFAQAFERGARSSKLMWDLGRIGQISEPDTALAALEELTKREQANVEARLELAVVHGRAQRWSQSLITARQITNITAAQAPRLFAVKAQAELQLGLRDEARKSANELLKYAKNDAERGNAQRMIDYLDRVEAAEQARAAAEAARQQIAGSRREERVETPALAGQPSPPPALIRREPTEEEIRRSILYDANGKFVELDCKDDTAVMVLETEAGRKRFHIDQPNRIIVTGSADGFAELNCGAQKNARTMRIQFSEAPPEAKADGLLRAVHFPRN